MPILHLTHDLPAPRPATVVEVALPAALWHTPLKVVGGRGRRLLTQRLDLDGLPGEEGLLVLVDLPKGRSRLRVLPLKAGESPLPEDGLRCHGRHVPERLDDVAWENDKVAFRLYGPALAATPGEVSGSGIDVWSKRVSRPILDTWYARGDYHADHGEGLDAYKVGTSRGCGGTGVLVDGRLHAAGVYATQRVLATGPLRVVFEVGYAPYPAGGATVSETKRISLDRGSAFFRVDTRVAFQGATTITFAAGLARRKGEEPPAQGPGWVATMEPAARHGRIATALLLPQGHAQIEADQALLTRTVNSGDTLTHWAGAGWDRAGTPDLAAWAAAVRQQVEALAHPVRTRLSR